MAWTVFIDGKEGTTGLRIFDRLAERGEFSLLTLPEEKRKDADARREAIHAADIAILCLPDAAARESVALAEGSNTRILDTSTAHRVAPGWAYGFPELSKKHRDAVVSGQYVAVPGCHASGFIALAAPLVAPGGYLVLCSCSHAADLTAFRSASARGIGRGGRRMQLLHTGQAGPDHPTLPQLAETGYLKALFFRLDG